jgi:hypothetical protein
VKVFSLFLLLCFTMVLTPNHWWHHCSHHEHHKTELSHTDTLDEDCPVCDLSLSAFTRPTNLVTYVLKQKPIVNGNTIYTSLSTHVFSLQQLRAPPATSV